MNVYMSYISLVIVFIAHKMKWLIITGLTVIVVLYLVTTVNANSPPVTLSIKTVRHKDPKSHRKHPRPGNKTFKAPATKVTLKPEVHVQQQLGEQPPTDEVKQMVQKNSEQIKNRAQLPVITDEDRADLSAAPLDALAFIHYQDEDNEIYLIKAIIGNQYVVHVKIAAKRLASVPGGSFRPDVENSVVMLVIPDKDDVDKLNREEFDNPPKPE